MISRRAPAVLLTALALPLAVAAAAPTITGPDPERLAIALPVRDLRAEFPDAAIFDLKDVLARVAPGNLDTRIARSVVDAAWAERRSAVAAWWPDLTVGALSRHTDGMLQGTFGDLGEATFETALLGAIVRWNLNPGEIHHRGRAALEAASAAEAGADGVLERARAQAAARYIELAGAVALVGLARQTRDDAAEFLRLTRALEEKGIAPGVDVQRARAEAARREDSVATAERVYRVASARLAETLDLDPAVPILPAEASLGPVDLPPPEDPEDLVALALAGRPEVRAAGREVAAAEARLAALRWGAFGPDVTLEVQQSALGLTFSDTGAQSIYTARLGVTLRPDQAGELRAARARLEAARLREARARLGVRTEVVEAREAVVLSHRRLGPAREALEAAGQALRISQVRFASGLGSALEILQAQDAVAAARVTAAAVLVEAGRSVTDLRRAVGIPIESM